VHPLLEIDDLDALDRALLRRLLRAGPWAWPPADDEPAMERARCASELSDPPEPGAGAVLLAAVRDAGPNARSTWCDAHTRPAMRCLAGPVPGASLWWIDRGAGAAAPAPDVVGLGQEALAAWDIARALLPATTPAIWNSVAAAHSRRPLARRLATLARPSALPGLERQLDGESFGLALFLGLASEVLETSLPADLVASAAIRPDGSLGPVRGLEAKAEVVARYCPRIRRLLVANGQDDASVAVARDLGLDVVPCRTVGEAFTHVIPDPTAALVRLGRDARARGRGDPVRAFFHLALGPREAVHEWRPVAEAARIALDEWPDLDEDARSDLDFARAVALRHAGNEGGFRLPSPRWLARLPQPRRLEAIAHAVQQAADAAPTAADADAAETLARAHLVRGLDAFEGHLAILGALARLLAVTGRPDDALCLAAEAVRGFVERRLAASASHALCLQVRLAGDLHSSQAFATAEEAIESVALAGAPEVASGPYLALARGRALVALGRFAEALPFLEPLGAPLTDEHLRCSADRFRIRALRALARESEAAVVLAALRARTDLPGTSGEKAVRALALVDLDAALADGDGAAAASSLVGIREIEPAVVGHLERAAPARQEDAATHVARFFPY